MFLLKVYLEVQIISQVKEWTTQNSMKNEAIRQKIWICPNESTTNSRSQSLRSQSQTLEILEVKVEKWVDLMSEWRNLNMSKWVGYYCKDKVQTTRDSNFQMALFAFNIPQWPEKAIWLWKRAKERDLNKGVVWLEIFFENFLFFENF